jgi:uncharacterized LabA/DUF88 family protein
MPKPTAIVYIDGLNLQRRLVDFLAENIWVDYWRLVESVLPNFSVLAVHVFTTPITSPEVSVATSIWHAQERIYPSLSIHLGRMKKTTRIYPLPQSAGNGKQQNSVKVIKYEEKGSDVALATRLALDAVRNSASIYYVMTSDTDFEPLLRLLKSELDVRLGVLCTTKNFPKLFSKLELDDIRHVKPKDLKHFGLKSLSP